MQGKMLFLTEVIKKVSAPYLHLKEAKDSLKYIMKSSSSDAETPEWHLLSSAKKGWF